MSKSPPPGYIRNHTCEMGAQLGAQLARFTEQAAAEHPEMESPCGTCAFRLGTWPNRSLGTTADALKCAMERTEFECHENGETCRGWLLMTKDAGSPVLCPWPHVGRSNEEVAAGL